jgi:hypothetical protein
MIDFHGPGNNIYAAEGLVMVTISRMSPYHGAQCEILE